MSAGELQREHIKGSQQGSIRDALQAAVEAEQLSVKKGTGTIPHMYATLGYDWPK